VGGKRRKPGERFGQLTLVEYAGNSHWEVECDCGARKVKHLGHLLNKHAKTCGDRDAHPRPSKGDGVGYCAAHDRATQEHGPASGYHCACGCGEMAFDWAYLGGAPDEKVSTEKGSVGCLYSPTIDYYVPMNRLCHKRFDLMKEAV
jgi:hypothetical protein